jgi:outer membrane receptor protein involved in Fe transport
MTRFGLLGTSALRSAAFAGFALIMTSSALAQDPSAPAPTQSGTDAAQPPTQTAAAQPPEAAPPAAPEEEGAIIITGSRIRRPNLESTIPITSIGGNEFFETGRTSVGDVLNELPALRSTFSQANSTQFLGTAGLNLLELRGLGTQRTLVLQNGRRHVAGDILNNAVSPDTNTIPTDLIERVDVVTGGNSAIYGSDAIAGVVNFVLKQDYEGVQLRGQGGISKYGDAGSYYASALAGTNFADGRGNIAINVEYARQNDFYASRRPNLRNTQGFVVVDSDPPGTPNGSDGVPDRQFFTDIRSRIFSNQGTFLSFDPATGFVIPYIFQPDGTLLQQTGDVVGLPPFGSAIGGNGSNFREGTQFGLSPKLDRYSVNLLGHFKFSDAFVPFIEAKYVRTDSLGNASGPFFFSGGTTGSPREFFFTDNPFLNPQAAEIIRDYYGVGPGTDVPFFMTRNVVELSNREEKAKRETYRIVGGVRGTFNDDWNYEVSANYGEFKERTQILGNVNLQRFLLAIDAVRDPATGNIVCRASIDPAARIALEVAADPAFAAAQLANDVSACVPVNMFGEGNISDAARDYLLQDSFARGKITQLVLNGFVSGDSSQLLELPGGPVGFAIGAEYRRETAFYDQDDFSQAGLTFYNAIPTFDPPSFEVKEAFGELRLPILKDTSFFQELTLNAAGRISDYKGATGTTYAYNAGLDWAPIRDLRLRGNYSRAVRAPNLVELFTPLGQNFTPPPDDPCSLRNIGTGSATREANCRADGVPTNFDFVYRQSLGFLSGGNPDLKEEKSDSYTVGGVLQPRFLPGFSLSVDFYDITVNDVITSPSAQDILNSCYDAATLDNQFCALVERAGAGGGPRGEIPGQILENSLRVVPLNYAKLKVRGIDFEAAYRRTIGGIGNLNTRIVYTRVLKNDTFLDPTEPGRADQVLLELGDPRDAFNWDISLKHGAVTLGYKMRYIGKMVVNQYEDFFSKQGRPPENADYADQRFYTDVFYHDVRVGIDAGDNFNFYLGVDNLANRLPPSGLTGIGDGSGIYRNTGRFFYAGAIAKF